MALIKNLRQLEHKSKQYFICVVHAINIYHIQTQTEYIEQTTVIQQNSVHSEHMVSAEKLYTHFIFRTGHLGNKHDPLIFINIS